jgi:hypothetical protein
MSLVDVLYCSIRCGIKDMPYLLLESGYLAAASKLKAVTGAAQRFSPGSRISNKRNTDTRHVQPRLAPRVTGFLLVGGKKVRDQKALLNRYGTLASTKPRTDVFMVARPRALKARRKCLTSFKTRSLMWKPKPQ